MASTASPAAGPSLFDNQYAKRFAALYEQRQPIALADYQLVLSNPSLARQLGLSDEPASLAALTAATKLPAGAQPLAQKYAGHQFGHYNPYLGDGRGLLLGEINSQTCGHQDLHIKGAGVTAFSRHGDGRAVLRSSLREFLASEAVFHLGIPSTRALALVKGTQQVQRERLEPQAMLTRVATTHIRFGHFEHCYHRGLTQPLTALFDYLKEVIWTDLATADNLQVFQRTVQRTAEMVAKWQVYGFCHGVMNTDNMSIVGETFDYGPFAFLDDYQPDYICNHTDTQGRYRFDRQPSVALWNLNCLAMAVSPLIDSDALVAALKQYEVILNDHYWGLMSQRLGLLGEQPGDDQLIAEWLTLLREQQQDYTQSFVALTQAQSEGYGALLRVLGASEALQQFWQRLQQRYQRQEDEVGPRQQRMQQCNPRYILRNYYAQQAISAAEQGDMSLAEALYQCLQQPFNYQNDVAQFLALPPAQAKSIALSCSS
ncbi:protein adenylyltransferase SelO [Idiomarina xiamenensis]|uniref:Protein nucleotidyltransferase YdiU n=1 Tax=Idiomarina xiamenensis 10-D-4 TaxID=740709 RepID=K2KQL2_9GAMM|nr:YdiU family protein [Idiomarina xiamenensis]EKE84729.1 hypothetical protein A10D4_03925 [Idiomarina xiamenensis 10-D-4]